MKNFSAQLGVSARDLKIILINESLKFFFSSRRRHTILTCDWSSDVCSSDLRVEGGVVLVLLVEDEELGVLRRAVRPIGQAARLRLAHHSRLLREQRGERVALALRGPDPRHHRQHVGHRGLLVRPDERPGLYNIDPPQRRRRRREASRTIALTATIAPPTATAKRASTAAASTPPSRPPSGSRFQQSE